MAIIIQGNIFDGHHFHGPFQDCDDAIEWAERNLSNVDWLVANTQAPKHGDGFRPDPFDTLRDVESWLANGGEVDGVYFDEASLLARVRETLASASDMAEPGA